MTQQDAFALLWMVGIRAAARVQADATRTEHAARIARLLTERAALDAMRGAVN